MTALILEGIGKSYDGVETIRGIDLEVAAGEFVVLVGSSGSGKSTVLRLIAGLEDVSAGTIRIRERDVTHAPAAARGVAMVFQSYALYPHMTVRENMGFALRFAGTPKAEIEKQVNEAARILELQPLLDRRPKELSGGQRQRVAIGRAIVRHPQVFLFDEPLSNLDAELRVHMRIEIARLHQELQTTIIYVTHDQVEAMTLADKIVVMRAGEVEQVGSPLKLYDDPDNLFVAGFIGSPKMNFLAGLVEAGGIRLPDHGNQLIPVATRAPVGTRLTVGIRPEHFRRDGSAALQLNVEMVEHLGAETYAYARYGTGELLTLATQNDREVAGGQAITAHFDPARALLFDGDGRRLR